MDDVQSKRGWLLRIASAIEALILLVPGRCFSGSDKLTSGKRQAAKLCMPDAHAFASLSSDACVCLPIYQVTELKSEVAGET